MTTRRPKSNFLSVHLWAGERHARRGVDLVNEIGLAR